MATVYLDTSITRPILFANISIDSFLMKKHNNLFLLKISLKMSPFNHFFKSRIRQNKKGPFKEFLFMRINVPHLYCF